MQKKDDMKIRYACKGVQCCLINGNLVVVAKAAWGGTVSNKQGCWRFGPGRRADQEETREACAWLIGLRLRRSAAGLDRLNRRKNNRS